MPAAEPEVLIVGAGPVGLLLANLLGRAGIPTIVLEKRTTRGPGSKAIGITPTSLGILSELGLAARFLARGVPVRRAAVHADTGVLARIELGTPGATFPFILSLPQADTEALLAESLAGLPGGGAAPGPGGGGGAGGGAAPSRCGRARWTAEELELRARLLCACDGAGSSMAGCLGLRRRARRYPVAFRMGDYADRSGLGDGGAPVLHPAGFRGVLPHGRRSAPLDRAGRRKAGSRSPRSRRWRPRCARAPARTWTRGTGCGPAPSAPSAPSWRASMSGRVAFCGDAAHTMAPIGGQGMNTGFADARLLARVAECCLRGGEDLAELLALYGRYRRAGFRAAARRSRLFMGVGTLRFPGLRGLRNLLVPVLARPPFSRALVGHFTMVSVPYSTLAERAGARGRLRLDGEGQAHEAPRR